MKTSSIQGLKWICAIMILFFTVGTAQAETAATEAAAAVPAVEKPAAKEPTAEKEKKSWKLKGYVQTYYEWYETKPAQDTFKVRRAFLTFEGALDDFDYRLQANLASSTDVLQEAYVTYKGLPYVALRLGQFKIPFSEEWLTSSSKIDTVFRSRPVSEFSYDRDLGLMAEGKVLGKRLAYAAGVFNGAKKNKADNNHDKDAIGRLVISPWAGSEGFLAGLSIAAAAHTGQQPASGAVRGLRNRYDGTLIYRFETIKVQGEYIFQEQQQIAGGFLASDGWYGLAAWRFLPMLEGVVKYEQYDPNRNQDSDRSEIMTAGLNVYPSPSTKLQANFVLEKVPTVYEPQRMAVVQAQFEF